MQAQNFQKFDITPTNPNFSIVYALRVTSLTGETIGKVYQTIALPPWVTFDGITRKISILTLDTSSFGNYTMAIVATCPQFPTV